MAVFGYRILENCYFQRFNRCFRICLSVIGAIVALSLAERAFGTETMLVVKQTDTVTGHFTAFLSTHGVKLISKEHNFTFISRAPDWKIYLFNDESKKYFVVSPKDLKASHSNFLLSNVGLNFSNVRFTKLKSYVTSGVAVEKFSLVSGKPQSDDEERHEGESTVLANSPIPAPVARAICRFYCLPEHDKFVLEARDKAYSPTLTFANLVGSPYNPSVYKFSLEGFKLAKNEAEVTMHVTDSNLLGF